MPLNRNEVEFNESYILAGFQDVQSLTDAAQKPINKGRIVSMGDRNHIIQIGQKYRPKGDHPTDSIRIIKLASQIADAMKIRYDNLKYLAILRKSKTK